IRPHFLFNSMNTIAALTRSDPARAEEAVEDLSDLFRATLRDSHSPLRLKEELELTRIYQRIEALRLGDRLHVTWDVAELPMRAPRSAASSSRGNTASRSASRCPNERGAQCTNRRRRAAGPRAAATARQ